MRREETCERVRSQICIGQLSGLDVRVQPVRHGLAVMIPDQIMDGVPIEAEHIRGRCPAKLAREVREMMRCKVEKVKS